MKCCLSPFVYDLDGSWILTGVSIYIYIYIYIYIIDISGRYQMGR